MKTFAIQPLHDHHSHFSLYAALSSMPSLADVEEHGRALDIIRGISARDIAILPGWNSSRFKLTPADLGNDKPVIVLNLSLHGLVMNCAAVFTFPAVPWAGPYDR